MGLNMPTKTVVFNGIRKHDGTEFRNLLGSEYTQMSGRAGRRGLDEKGMVVGFFHQEKDLPPSLVLKEMIGSKGESLYSKFKISYSILFNALSSQIIELEEIMKKSFGENENYVQLKELKTNREKIKAKQEENKIKCDFIDIEEVPPIYDFKQKVDDLYDRSQHFFGVNSSYLEIQRCQDPRSAKNDAGD
jgi:antiviral helicase SKI2